MALASIPASAAGEAYVPPGNSAATQYTEAVPTAGGPKATTHSKHAQSRSPKKVLGARKTAKLDAQGPQGRAAAEVAALTAPSAVGSTAVAGHGGSGQGAQTDSLAGQGGGGGGGSGSGDLGRSARPATAAPPAQTVGAGSDASGIGEVIGQATGSPSSGEPGLWLPLLIVAAVVWSGAYAVRRRRKRLSA